MVILNSNQRTLILMASILIMASIAAYFGYQNRLDNVSREHQYRVFNAEGYFSGYAYDIKLTQTGCIETSNGILCGSFSTKPNIYYNVPR